MRKTYGKTQKRNSVKRGSGWVVLGKVFSANKGMFTARKSNLFIMFSSETRRCLWERGKVISNRRRERAEPKKSVASRRISRRCSLTALSLFRVLSIRNHPRRHHLRSLLRSCLLPPETHRLPRARSRTKRSRLGMDLLSRSLPRYSGKLHPHWNALVSFSSPPRRDYYSSFSSDRSIQNPPVTQVHLHHQPSKSNQDPTQHSSLLQDPSEEGCGWWGSSYCFDGGGCEVGWG